MELSFDTMDRVNKSTQTATQNEVLNRNPLSHNQSIEFLEHQIIALDKKWLEYEKNSFIDWNQKFKGINIKDIKPFMRIPLKDINTENKEFNKLWHKTIKLFSDSVKLLKKKKHEKAMIKLFSEIRTLDSEATRIEMSEKNTINFLTKHRDVFEPLFDSNYGNGYFENEVLANYRVRFDILEILKKEYELARFFLSDIY